jgi:NTP pyrophosphatase (non-canonical NTP hydrolase)
MKEAVISETNTIYDIAMGAIQEHVAIEKRHAEMVTMLAKPGAAILGTMTPEKAHLLHMAVGISGEVGEVLQALVRSTEVKSNEEAQEVLDNVREELGDIEFYMEGLRQGIGVSRYEIIAIAERLSNPMVKAIPPVGIAVFAGNVLDQVKKHVIYNKELALQELKNELAGLEYHLSAFRSEYRFHRTDSLNHVYNKLIGGEKARYKDGYSDKAAQERADKQ